MFEKEIAEYLSNGGQIDRNMSIEMIQDEKEVDEFLIDNGHYQDIITRLKDGKEKEGSLIQTWRSENNVG